MKVSLRKEDETSGWLSKTTEYALYVKVELTPEERIAIKAAGIEDFLLMEYSYKGNGMEQKVKESLAALKSQIQAQMSGGAGSESFEL
jgi:hypothetical protein